MTTLPVLVVPIFDKLFVIETDASGKGLGQTCGIYEHKYKSGSTLQYRNGDTIYFESNFLYIQIRKAWGFWWTRELWVESNKSGWLNCWGMVLRSNTSQEYKIEWLMHALQKVTVCCSIHCAELWMGWLGGGSTKYWKIEKIDAGFSAEPRLSYYGFQIVRGWLYYKGRIVMPHNSPKIPMTLNEFHNSAVEGHAGYFQIANWINIEGFWKGYKFCTTEITMQMK